MAHVLLAIKPRFADLIFSGEKQVEVRRGGTSIVAGDTLVFYRSSPDSAVQGVCVVTGVDTRSARSAVESLNGHTGLSKRELTEYLAGADRVSLLTLGPVQRLLNPIPLSELRTLSGMSSIPQSYRFLTDLELKKLAPRLRTA